jgi:hypothetical protein
VSSPTPPLDEWPAEANVGKPWTDKLGRTRQPAVMFEDDHGNRRYGQAAIPAFTAHVDSVRERRLSRVTRTPRNRERRPAASRRSSSSSRTSSTDPGDSDPAGPPPAAPRWRRVVTVDERFVVTSIELVAAS